MESKAMYVWKKGVYRNTRKNIVRTSEGETGTETVCSVVASAGGGDASASETRVSSSSATDLIFV